jgi:hypothetical protein
VEEHVAQGIRSLSLVYYQDIYGEMGGASNGLWPCKKNSGAGTWKIEDQAIGRNGVMFEFSMPQ